MGYGMAMPPLPLRTPIGLDARGLRCPMPVLRLRKVLMEAPVGTTCLVEADDPAAARDIPAFCAEMGWACSQPKARQWLVRRTDL